MEGVGGLGCRVCIAEVQALCFCMFSPVLCSVCCFSRGGREGLRVGFGFRILSSRPIRSRMGKSRTSLLHVSWNLLQTSVLLDAGLRGSESSPLCQPDSQNCLLFVYALFASHAAGVSRLFLIGDGAHVELSSTPKLSC